MLDRIKYLDVTNILAAQKEVRIIPLPAPLCDRADSGNICLQRILTEIRQVSQSHIVHPGLDFFKNRPAGSTASIDPLSVPGLKESGWTPEMDALFVLFFSFLSFYCLLYLASHAESITVIMTRFDVLIEPGDRSEVLNSP